MTNSELAIKFAGLAAGNPFDAVIELKKLNKIYKKTSFYQTTHMSIYKAYEFYCKTTVGRLYYDIKAVIDTDRIAEKLTDILNGIDQTAIDTFFDHVINTFSNFDLQQEKGEAKVLINKLKDVMQ